MVCKIFFCYEFPVIPEKWWRKEEEEKQLRSVLLFKQTQLFQLVRTSEEFFKKSTGPAEKKFQNLTKLTLYLPIFQYVQLKLYIFLLLTKPISKILPLQMIDI